MFEKEIYFLHSSERKFYYFWPGKNTSIFGGIFFMAIPTSESSNAELIILFFYMCFTKLELH